MKARQPKFYSEQIANRQGLQHQPLLGVGCASAECGVEGVGVFCRSVLARLKTSGMEEGLLKARESFYDSKALLHI